MIKNTAKDMAKDTVKQQVANTITGNGPVANALSMAQPAIQPIAQPVAQPTVVPTQANIGEMLASYQALKATVQHLEARLRKLETPPSNVVKQVGQAGQALQQIGQAPPNPVALQQAGHMINAVTQKVSNAVPVVSATTGVLTNQVGGGAGPLVLLTSKEYATQLIRIAGQYDQKNYRPSTTKLNQLTKAIEIERGVRNLTNPSESKAFIMGILSGSSSNSQASHVLNRIRRTSNETHNRPKGSGPVVPILTGGLPSPETP